MISIWIAVGIFVVSLLMVIAFNIGCSVGRYEAFDLFAEFFGVHIKEED